MKKLSFLLGAAAFLTAACSTDEVVDVAQTQGIGFNTFVNNSTRATDLTNDQLKTTGFSVYGVTLADNKAVPSTVFNNQEVKWDEGAGAFTYAPLRYWAAGNNYRFSAIAPYGIIVDEKRANNCLEVNQSIENITDFDAVKGGLTLTFDNQKAAADVDLCYAFNTVKNALANQPAVKLDFKHMLSRVMFTFKNTFPSNLSTIKITDLKITDATSKATINKVNGEELWTVADDSTPFEIPFTQGLSTGDITDKTMIPGGGQTQPTNHHYLIPLKGAMTYNISFKITLYNYGDGQFHEMETYTHNVTLPATEYKNNYSYNFIAEIDYSNINPDGQLYPIKFTPTVTKWEDFKDSDNIVPKKEDTGTGSETPAP